MRVGILLAGAIEMKRRISDQTMVAWIKRSMLPGEDQSRLEAARGERMRDRS